jgi:hypothetical protein
VGSLSNASSVSNMTGGGGGVVSSTLSLQTKSTNDLDGQVGNGVSSSMQGHKTTVDDSNYLTGGSTTTLLSQMSKDLIFNSENRSRLGLLKTCIALIPRMMPMFKGQDNYYGQKLII